MAAEKPRLTMALGDQVTVEVPMCPEERCVLAAGHPPGKHAQRRVSTLACPHNVPNFGPECPICDVASVQLGGKVRYEMRGDPIERHRPETVTTVEHLDMMPDGTLIREVRERVAWVKREHDWHCVYGWVPGTRVPLFPAEVVAFLDYP